MSRLILSSYFRVASILLGKLRYLHMVAIEQVARSVFHGCDGQPVTNLRLHQAQLGLRQFRLSFEREENRLRAQSVLALLGLQILLRQVQSNFRGLHANF